MAVAVFGLNVYRFCEGLKADNACADLSAA